VAKKVKDPNEPSRAFKRAQAAAERSKAQKKSKAEKYILIVSLIVSAVAIAVIIHKHTGGSKTGKNDPTYKALNDIGTTPFVSGCAAVAPTDDPVPDRDVVVPPGQRVKYPVAPPSSGPHLANPVAVNADGFYDVANRPPVEGLVANLNAGWTVLWYDPNSLTPEQVSLIKKAAGVLHRDPRYSLFVAAPWDDSYGKLPEGTPIALTRWTKTSDDNHGHRAYCHETSGEAFRQFMEFYGAPPIAGLTDQDQ
jgi:hypothetical protein